MKPLFKYSFIMAFFALFMVSCQDEEVRINNPSTDEVVDSNSSLASLMRSTVTYDGSRDNILDNASCIGVNLPVTVTANDTTITIETLDDLDLIQEIFEAFNNDEDVLEFLFPITITLSNHTEVVIEDAEALETFVDACVEEPNIIECVDFVYPIVFSIYNTNFQIIDTVQIESDLEMYVFLEGLETGNQGAVLASINFPISLVYANGNTIEVLSNQELQEAINAADEDCNYIECEEEEIHVSLKECHWTIAEYTANGDYLGFDFYFDENNNLQIIYGTGALTVSGNWDVSEVDGRVIVEISELSDFNALEGNWIVQACENDRLVLSQASNSSVVEMVLEQDCSMQPSPFNCFENYEIEACELDITTPVQDAVFNLNAGTVDLVDCDVEFTASFYVSITDAENQTNPIANTETYQSVSTTVYLRVESLGGDFQVFDVQLQVQECVPNCSESDIDTYLQECVWNVVRFNNDDHLISYDFEFSSNTDLVITGGGLTINANWSTSVVANGTILELYNVSGPNIQAVNDYWLIQECEPGRLQMISGNNITMVMERTCQSCDNPGFLTNDLVVYVPFSNETVDLMNDSAQTIQGTGSYVEDRAGNASCATAFNGSQSVSIPVSVSNQIIQGDNFSVSLWFKMQNDNLGNLEILFQKGEVNSEGFQLAVYDGNTPLVSDTTNGYGLWDNDWNQEVDVQWENTDWHHLVVTRDSNNTIRLYRDGQLRNTEENYNFDVDSEPLYNYILGQGFTGHLDDLRVYKRTLSSNEVGDLYQLEADCNTCL